MAMPHPRPTGCQCTPYLSCCPAGREASPLAALAALTLDRDDRLERWRVLTPDGVHVGNVHARYGGGYVVLPTFRGPRTLGAGYVPTLTVALDRVATALTREPEYPTLSHAYA